MSAPSESLASPFQQRLVAESLRVEEERAGRTREAPMAEERARGHDGDLEARIRVRAMALDEHGARLAGVQRVAGTVRLAFLILGIVAGLAGLTAAGVALGTDSQVNIVRAIVTLLAVQILALFLWGLLIVMPFSRGGVLGRIVMMVAGWLGRRLAATGEGMSAASVTLSRLTRGDIGRGLLGTATHTLWFAYTAGALAGALVLMAIYQYDFYWATTILSEEVMVALLTGLGVAPGMAGFTVPDQELVRFSRQGMEPGYGRQAWSGLIVGSLIVFGLIPRLLFAVLCALQLRSASAAFRLDLTRAGYARLAHRLEPASARLGRKGPPPSDQETGQRQAGLPEPVDPAAAPGLVYLVGMEREPESDWPPSYPELATVEALGYADDRAGRRDILAIFENLPAPPGRVLVLVPFRRTPDRGMGSFLQALGRAASAPVWLLLEGLGKAPEPGRQRIGQWQELAGRAGVERVQEVGQGSTDGGQKP